MGAFLPGNEVRPAVVAWARTLPTETGEPLLRALGVESASPIVAMATSTVAAGGAIGAAGAGSTSRKDRERIANDAVLAMAERLDIGARSLRRALSTLLTDLDADGIGLDTLRVVAARSSVETKRQT
jgi:hypothetical protein